jgi:hypothetical protein
MSNIVTRSSARKSNVSDAVDALINMSNSNSKPLKSENNDNDDNQVDYQIDAKNEYINLIKEYQFRTGVFINKIDVLDKLMNAVTVSDNIMKYMDLSDIVYVINVRCMCMLAYYPSEIRFSISKMKNEIIRIMDSVRYIDECYIIYCVCLSAIAEINRLECLVDDECKCGSKTFPKIKIHKPHNLSLIRPRKELGKISILDFMTMAHIMEILSILPDYCADLVWLNNAYPQMDHNNIFPPPESSTIPWDQMSNKFSEYDEYFKYILNIVDRSTNAYKMSIDIDEVTCIYTYLISNVIEY